MAEVRPAECDITAPNLVLVISPKGPAHFLAFVAQHHGRNSATHHTQLLPPEGPRDQVLQQKQHLSLEGHRAWVGEFTACPLIPAIWNHRASVCRCLSLWGLGLPSDFRPSPRAAADP